jgi:hypothetical protein
MRTLAVVALLLAPSLNTGVAGQSGPEPGDRLRIRTLEGVVRTGTVEGASAQEVRLTHAYGTWSIPQSDIDTMERSLGQQRRFARNFFLTVGIASGAIGTISALSWSPCYSTEFLGCLLHPESRTDAFAWGAFGGLLLGIPIGTVIGLVDKSERWEALSSGTGSGVALAVRPSVHGLLLTASIPFGGAAR